MFRIHGHEFPLGLFQFHLLSNSNGHKRWTEVYHKYFYRKTFSFQKTPNTLYLVMNCIFDSAISDGKSVYSPGRFNFQEDIAKNTNFVRIKPRDVYRWKDNFTDRIRNPGAFPRRKNMFLRSRKKLEFIFVYQFTIPT